MPDYPLSPRQDDLLRKLLEAEERQPDLGPFRYLNDNSDGSGRVLLVHCGWLQDAPPVYLHDLDVLDDEGYIGRRFFRGPAGGGEFHMTPKALAYCNADRLTGECPKDARIFRKQGEMWFVAYEGVSAWVRHSVGMSYIEHLLQTPGEEIHAAALRACVSGSCETVVAGSLGEVLDRQALAGIRDQVREIDEDIAEAQDENDPERARVLAERKELLIAHVGRATGLHGKPREVSPDHELARQSVCKAVHRALEAIKTQHEPLWQHLHNFLDIGGFLSYRSDQDTIWTT